jgi:hypothetical protein
LYRKANLGPGKEIFINGYRPVLKIGVVVRIFSGHFDNPISYSDFFGIYHDIVFMFLMRKKESAGSSF